MDRGDIILITSGDSFIAKDSVSGLFAYGGTMTQAIETLKKIISEKNTEYESA